MERLLHLSTLSMRFSQLAPGTLDFTRLAQTYQTALRDRKLATANGSVKMKALIDMTLSHYRGVETVPGFEVLQSITPDWPGLAGTLTRHKPKHGHPLKHLLLIAMLFEDWDDFISAYETQPISSDPPSGASEESRIESAADEFHNLVVNEGLSIRAASNKVGISVTTGVQWARKQGISFRVRTKFFTEERKAEVRKLLRRGLDLADVAAVAGVSRISINRLRASEPDLGEAWRLARFLTNRKSARSQFAQLIREHPNASVKELREFPRNPYMWLYRHDRAWLRDKLPSLWKRNLQPNVRSAKS